MSAKSQPEEDAGDGEQGCVGNRQLVVAGGNGAMLLEAIDRPFHDVAFAIGRAVEAHPTAGFVGASRDDRPDAAPPQGLAHRPVYPLSPAMRSGRIRGRPRPARLTAPPARSAST